MAQKQSALILSLGGAPETWHFLPGGPAGLYHPNIPTPLDDAGISAADAKKLDADDGVPLAVVSISENKANEAAKAQQDAREEARTATVDARRQGVESPEEQERINDQAAALSGQKEG